MRKSRSLVILVLTMLVGCATDRDPVIANGALMEPNQTKGAVVITRSSSLLGFHCDHLLSLDGNVFAQLRPSQAVTIYPSPGQHRLSVQVPNSSCNSDAALTIMVELGQRKMYETSGLRNGEVALTPMARKD